MFVPQYENNSHKFTPDSARSWDQKSGHDKLFRSLYDVLLLSIITPIPIYGVSPMGLYKPVKQMYFFQ